MPWSPNFSAADARRGNSPTPMQSSAGIAGELRGGDVVAILSNGGFGGIYEKLPARLRQRSH